MTSKSKPRALPGKHQAGVCLHITSLPGPYGIGELGECARTFIDKMSRMQLSVWQFLPIGPTAYGDSPYQPLSTFAGNEMLIDVDNLIDLGLLDDSEVVELTTLPERSPAWSIWESNRICSPALLTACWRRDLRGPFARTAKLLTFPTMFSWMKLAWAI